VGEALSALLGVDALGVELLSGGLGAALAAALAGAVLAARFADRPAWPERFGVAAGVVPAGAVVVSADAGSGLVLIRGVAAGAGAVGAVVAAATGAALLARSPGV
jgi:hypothetical protein